ncbi:MAG: shikimate dehydrogenase [Chitinophagaceae bacterium]|nr:MAG: shikimate dehydrogenase [Chitinophagaceae bacterium]
MKRFGLIGYPLSHSFSKKYFTDKFEKEGLKDHVYDIFPISSIDKLPEVLANNPDLVGLNVTIPYKQQILQYLDASNLPEGVQACNCIKIENGKLTGNNTDITGFRKSFAEKLQPHHQRAIVLGNGGATAAVVYVLQTLNIEYEIVSRKLHQGSTLTYDDLTNEVIKHHTVIINTTPLGTFPNVEEAAPIPYNAITTDHYLFDLIYNPDKTLFLKKGEEHGATIKNGYDMLVIQAEESWKIWK